MDDFEDRGPRKAHGGPYTSKHPVPTIRGYREHRAEIKQREGETSGVQDNQDGDAGESKTKRAYESIKTIAKDEDKDQGSQDPYPTANRNLTDKPDAHDPNDQTHDDESTDSGNGGNSTASKKDEEQKKSATETVASSIDPKEKRKTMKKTKRSGGGREVTDPVTHLPVLIHDMTDKDLQNTPENIAGIGSDHRTLTGAASKSQDQLKAETDELGRGHAGMRNLFPPPNFSDTKHEMMATYRTALLAGLGSVAALGFLALGTLWLLGTGGGQHSWSWFHRQPAGHAWYWRWSSALGVLALTGGVAYFVIHGISGWLAKTVDQIFEEETWDAARNEENERNEASSELPESVAWLNSLLASVWRLINPDLFASVVDTLEDVMQASLPKVVRMVSVDDIGQGSEAFRILGVRWLPTGAAGQSVDSEGNLKPAKDNDRTVQGQGQVDNAESQDQGSSEQSGENGEKDQDTMEIREGMEAEEGDFVNMELAFAYRARSSGKSIKSKAKNAHLYLKFYLPGDIAVPVWVELKGMVGIMRLRLQLTPDPPFFELCTLTFLGQPRVDLSCVPLSKHSLNLMNVPLISSFVQSSIDAALAEYVAPKSLTLDLKDMLVGDDFKKDTISRGVVLVHIKKARGFKEGDGGIGNIIKGSSDSYVAVSWGKLGKPVASTRIICGEQEPNFDEWAAILVSPDEINAEETLRLQLWDSDKHTADDDLGRTEVSLKELMHNESTKNRMCDREDGLTAEDPDETMPGALTWSVGYFSKAHIQQKQLDKQTFNPSIRTAEDLHSHVAREARNKLREALPAGDMSDELRQQETQDTKTLEDAMIISAPPLPSLPSGILSIQIHNITGLEVARQNRPRRNGADGDGEDREDAAEHDADLPDSYCTIILNHRKVYRTRTKPKNAKPFFNAGTERFIKDWRTAEVIVSVWDSREGEKDPLLGVVYLPLARVFATRSQAMGTYPLAGGIGYGRARVSMVWRSVELDMPRELTGWDYGTLEIKGPVRVVNQLPDGLDQCKLKMKTKIGKGKMYARDGEKGSWWPKAMKSADGESVFVGVIKRYASALVVEFRSPSLMSEDNPALAVLWLSDIPDEEEHTVRLAVWKGGKKQLRRARTCSDYRGLEEGEQPLGEIEMVVRFWRGLSGYHKAYASKSRNADVKAVMEVLDTVNDEKMADDGGDEESLASWELASGDESEDSSSSSSDDEDEGEGEVKRDSRPEAEKRKMLRKAGADSSSESDLEGEKEVGGGLTKLPGKVKKSASDMLEGNGGSDDDGKRGVGSQVQDYKRNHKRLHRKHKGVMQWKATRTLDWMADKAREGAGKVGGVMHHGEKEQGVETEV